MSQDEVVISVSSETIVSVAHFDQHVIYKIVGKDKIGPIDTQRRYKDFFALRQALLLKWTGCYIPLLPGKKTFGNDVKVVNDRIKFLEIFLLKLSKLPHLFNSPEVNQLFLRDKTPDIYKTLELTQKSSSAELIQKYQVHFGQLQGKDIDQSLVKKVDEFEEKLKSNQDQLRLAKKYIRETLQSQEALNKALDQTFNKRIPEFEREFFTGIKIFTGEANQEQLKKLQQDVIFKRVNMKSFLDFIRSQLKDIKGLQQMFKQKVEFESERRKLEQKVKDLQLDHQNIISGKTGFKNLFNKTSPDELKIQVTAQIQQTQNEIENYKVLGDIILAMIGFIEIERYQNTNATAYEQILLQLQQTEQSNIQEQQAFWQHIKEQTSIILSQNKQQEEIHIQQGQQQPEEEEELTIEHIEEQQDVVEQQVQEEQ